MAEFTKKQGQYLALIHLYRKLHRQGPAELDIAKYFRVSPASVHQMIVKLDELGLIQDDRPPTDRCRLGHTGIQLCSPDRRTRPAMGGIHARHRRAGDRSG